MRGHAIKLLALVLALLCGLGLLLFESRAAHQTCALERGTVDVLRAALVLELRGAQGRVTSCAAEREAAEQACAPPVPPPRAPVPRRYFWRGLFCC